MTENEIKSLWQATSLELAKSIRVNKENTERITRLQADKLLSSMKPTKIFLLVIGTIWVLTLGTFVGHQFIVAYHSTSPFFLYSLALQILLTAIAIGVYVYQLDLINKVDFSDSVISIQKRLTKLQLSTLMATRILFLQLPLWTIFYWNNTMFSNNNIAWWIVQGIVTITFTGMAVWLFFNIKYENRNKKWFRFLFSGKEWTPIFQSMELLNQLASGQEESTGKEDA